jgi:hypothetical protein
MAIDKRRPYGVIYGHSEAKYEQDGVLYKHDGTPILPTNTLTQKGQKHGVDRRNVERK